MRLGIFQKAIFIQRRKKGTVQCTFLQFLNSYNNYLVAKVKVDISQMDLQQESTSAKLILIVFLKLFFNFHAFAF